MRRAVLLISLLVSFCVRAEEPKRISDERLIGNYFAYFNPSAGGGTQMWAVDIDESGSYIAFCSSADFDAVRGQLAINGDKWTLSNDGKIIDKGTIEFMGPTPTLHGGKGTMMLNRANPESKQANLKEYDIDPKNAQVQPFIYRGLKMAREWRKDAVLVDVRCNPGFDGEIDLTAQGGGLMLMFYSPSRDAGALAMVSAWGEISLTPQKTPVSPWKLAIPTNVIEPMRAVKLAKENGAKRVEDAELYGKGDNPDTRAYCWVMRTGDGVICVDAVIPRVIDYNEFMNGQQRAGDLLPFCTNRCVVFRSTVTTTDDLYMYFFRKHPVFLDGVDEAIIVDVPWRFIPEEEWKPLVNIEKDGAMSIPDLSDKLDSGKYTPLTPEQFKRLSGGPEALLIDCPPGLVLLESCPKELIPRVKSQLESYWKSRDARQSATPTPPTRRRVRQ